MRVIFWALDRYFGTAMFAFLGWLNAESWPYLLVFVAVGLVIDIKAIPRQLGYRADVSVALADAPTEKLTWMNTVCLGYIGLAIITVTIVLIMASAWPGLVVPVGSFLFDLTGPFIALLRNHYSSLMAHNYESRAALTAIQYPFLFVWAYVASIVTYVGVARMLAANPSALAMPGIEKSIEKPSQALLTVVFVFSPLVAAALFITIFVDVAYLSENMPGRTLRLDIHESDVFFFQLAAGLFCQWFVLFFLFCAFVTKLAHRTRLRTEAHPRRAP